MTQPRPPPRSSSDAHSPDHFSPTSGSTEEQIAPVSSSQVDQRNMEFATLPSNHFGHLGLAQSPLDMRHTSSALPDYAARYHQSQYPHQVTQAIIADPHLVYSPFPGQQFLNHPNQFPSQYAQILASQYKGTSGYTTNTAINPDGRHGSQPHGHQQHQSFYTPNMSQQHQYSNFPGQHQMPYGHANTSPYQTRSVAAYQIPQLQPERSQMTSGPLYYPSGPSAPERKTSGSSSPTASALRGPPRKPKQSGHALWVGNLPPGTQITDLKDHFSRDATEDIESVFLISKSNCAFVNYKTEEACAAAMARFHDSRFRGVRLVCRLRRGSSSVVTPASGMLQPDTGKSMASTSNSDAGTSVPSLAGLSLDASSVPTPKSSPGKLAREKFFIVKSLTVEDLDRSVVSGIWATQAHNEENLNIAFETAENVYLIFSANKSGEYFGYARMESPISAEAVSAQELDRQMPPVPATQPTSAANDPLTITTPATSTAPRGHIVDDSARGTIFWEAESSESTPSTTLDATTGDSGDTSGDEGAAQASSTLPSTFGKPFHIVWQSTERLPFYRTRGLRNPWNANREVKIARDGTELEPSVGRKLLSMFEQQAQINAAARAGVPATHYVGYPQHAAQYIGQGMMPHMGYGHGPSGPGQPYGRPY